VRRLRVKFPPFLSFRLPPTKVPSAFLPGSDAVEREIVERLVEADYVAFCFGELAHANLFRAKCKGERFDPTNRVRENEGP
jgi:hypothetical protein